MTIPICFRRTVALATLLTIVCACTCRAGEPDGCRKQLLQIKQWLCEIHKAPIVTLDPSVKKNADLPFVSHSGPGRFDTALAMNVRYQPILELRKQITSILGMPLDFFKGWDPGGEAHVTVVTPLEYHDVLKQHVSIDRIDAIARDGRIQEAQLKVLGIGCGRAMVDGKSEETYFLVVESDDLLRVRQRIHDAYVAAGGRPGSWDPKHFYPHVTIGYTKRDLHEADGVIKDIFHSLDSRFNLSLRAR